MSRSHGVFVLNSVILSGVPSRHGGSGTQPKDLAILHETLLGGQGAIALGRFVAFSSKGPVIRTL